MVATNQDHEELENRLGYHPATEQTGPMHAEVRARALQFGHWLLDAIPGGRHQELAVTALQECMMWANAAVACDTVPEQPTPPVETSAGGLP